jgi:hypothetical protein
VCHWGFCSYRMMPSGDLALSLTRQRPAPCAESAPGSRPPCSPHRQTA